MGLRGCTLQLRHAGLQRGAGVREQQRARGWGLAAAAATGSLRAAVLLAAVSRLAGAAEAPFRPCTPTITEDCVPGRFVPCNATQGPGAAAAGSSYLTSLPADYLGCGEGPGLLALQSQVLVQFTYGAPSLGGQCLEILVRVGECWGTDSDGDDYGCMGRCGPGCQVESPGLCSNWSLNCLRHDVCSYYYNSAGGALDPACGYAFLRGTRDYVIPCLSDERCALQDFSTYNQVCASSSSASRFARYHDQGYNGFQIKLV